MDRRQFLKRGFGAAALTVMGTRIHPFVFAQETKKIPIAVQVYSVRDLAEKDLAGVLKKIAALGYRGVEFAGTYGHSAEEVKKMLDAAGLICVGTHLRTDDLLGEAFPKTVTYHKTIGNQNLVVAGGLGKAISTDDGNRFTAHLFNELADKARGVGCRVGFYAHGTDFTDIGGKTAWDLFFERTKPEIIAEMDIGNSLSCGADPYESMKKFPNRGTLIHLKASGPRGTVIGDENDKVDWKRAFEICETIAGTRWYIVEQESSQEGNSSLDAVAACMENLKKMGKV